MPETTVTTMWNRDMAELLFTLAIIAAFLLAAAALRAAAHRQQRH